jgi:hypothetical protein
MIFIESIIPALIRLLQVDRKLMQNRHSGMLQCDTLRQFLVCVKDVGYHICTIGGIQIP